MRSLRVVHLLPSVPFGGLQRLAIELAGTQRAAGLDARVIGIYRGTAVQSFALAEGVPIRTTPGQGFSPAEAWALATLLRSEKPALVHLHAGVLWSNVLTGLLRRWPIVAHLHNYPVSSGAVKPRLNEVVATRLGNRYIAVSRSVHQAFVERCPWIAARSSVIGNGIRLDRGAPLLRAVEKQPMGLRFGMATRIDLSKGVLELVEVMAAIARLLPEARFVIAGDGPALPAVRARASATGLDGKLELPGFIANIDEFWRTLDVALFTPPQEPFGLRLIEPIVQGVPVVAFRNGSGSDEVIDRCRGILACPQGDTAAFAHLARRLATESDLRRRTVEEGLADIRAHFSIDAMERQVRAVYDEVLDGRARTAFVGTRPA